MALLFAQDARQPHQRGCAGRGRTRICEPLVRVGRTLKIVTSKFSGFCLCENGGDGQRPTEPAAGREVLSPVVPRCHLYQR